MTLEMIKPEIVERDVEPPRTGGADVVEPRRWSVDEYHGLLRDGIFNHGDPYELLEGLIVRKQIHGPKHDAGVLYSDYALRASLPPGYWVRVQSAMTTEDSEPEPDLLVFRGNLRDFSDRHPGPAEVVLVVEVADSSLKRDRDWKGRINAKAGVEYWIVNVLDGVVERYTAPYVLPGGTTAYRDRADFRGDDLITPPVPGAAPIRAGDLLP